MISKFFYGALFASMVLVSFTSCDKDDDDDNNDQMKTYTISGNASGNQEVPAVSTTGSGNIVGTYTSNNNTLQYTINWTGLTGAPTAMHFHGPAALGQIANPVITISGWPAAAAGSVSGTAILSDTQESDMLAGKWYYNIHTIAYGAGEIRGQVTATVQ